LHVVLGADQAIALAEQAFTDDAQPYRTLGSFAVAPETWTNVEIMRDLDATPRLRFRVGDTDITLDREPEFLGPSPTRLRIGVSVAKKWAAKYWIDDVLVE